MATMTQHAPGTFCWTQLGTTDEAAAKKFYEGLFGWKAETTSASGRPLTLLTKGGKAIGAMIEQSPDQGPPSWTSFVAVTDVAKTAEAARGQGGKVLIEPYDVSPNGRFAVFQDPTGGVVAAWQAGTKPGAEILGEPGAMVWNELITTDSAKAGAYYERVFGWKAEAMPMPGEAGRTYTIFKRPGNDTGVGGMMTATPEMKLTHPYWMLYIAVDDTDKTAARAEELGAKIMMRPTDIPTVGRFAVIKDPQGAWFSILKPNPQQQ